MEKQTLLFTALPHGLDPDGALRLSVFISPRLESDDVAVSKLTLGQFPDWLNWPGLVAATDWKVTFEGQPSPVQVTAVSPAPRPDLWQALFRSDAEVVPFRFENHDEAEIETIDSGQIVDTLAGLYARAATEISYGAGTNLPPVEILAADPDLGAIARGSKEEIPPVPGPRPGPVDVGGKPPEPGPEPQPEPIPPTTPPPRPRDGCGCGCLFLPLAVLARLFPGLSKWLDAFFAKSSSGSDNDPPAEELKPTSWPEANAAPPAPAPFVAAPDVPAAAPKITPGGPPSAQKAAFDELGAFVTPEAGPPVGMPTPVELEDVYDFHSMISTLGDYPKLLRLLGLVVDLRVEFAAAPVASGLVQVEPVLALPLVTPSVVSSPRTHYLLDAGEFLAEPRPDAPEINHGLLRLEDATRFRVIQVDAVGGGLKLQNAATNIAVFAKPEDLAPNMPAQAGLPALRTGGVSVIRGELRNALREQLRRSLALQSHLAASGGVPIPPLPAGAPAPTDELYAEDLVRGYRVDVFDTKSNAWHSLCQRRGVYDFLNAPGAGNPVIEEDEGFVQFGATEPLDPAAAPKLKTTDSLFVWDGWSLSAPRPGKTIMPGDAADGTTIVAEPKNEAATKFKLEANFTAQPGTLPRLRFEYQYRLRARVCDLAGNSVFGPDDAAFAVDSIEQTPLFDCARYEPVSPPALMLQAAPIEGESVERLVVRSFADGLGTKTTERHVIPPKVSQLMAEQHGKFDRAAPRMDSSPAGYDLAAREAGALTDGAVQLPPADPARPSEAAWIHSGAPFTLTYLPDPSSRGAVLLGLPGVGEVEIIEPTPAKTVNKVPFGAAWPDRLPFRVRLVPIDQDLPPAEPVWNSAERVLTVELAMAQKKTVRLSSYLHAEDFAVQGVAHWTKEQAPLGFPQAELDTLAGRSWLHLPWRELTFLHAVQKPLAVAEITALMPEKLLGQTFVHLTGTVAAHVPSTGKVDLLAAWTDPIDDPALPAPTTRSHRAHVCEVPIAETDVATPVPALPTLASPLQDFGDMKFHAVNYTTVATTRFREYFPAALIANPANLSLPNPVAFAQVILNSARPDAPRVLYIVPVYEWRDQSLPGGPTERVRKGGGLRVYLDRPWHSSGDGELLGVVYLPEVDFLDFTEKEKTVATHWGADPIWASPAAADVARKEHFVKPEKGGDGLSLAEFEKPAASAAAAVQFEPAKYASAFAVAGFLVEFDAARKLWFADIQLDIGPAYAPFVRLALARFQPNSVPHAHLSRVVRADFVQLAADRTATVAFNSTAAGFKMEITVTGPTYTGSSVTQTTEAVRGLFGDDFQRKGLAEIEVLVQRRDPAFGAEADLGWETLPPPELLQQNPAVPGVWHAVIERTEALVPGAFRLLIQEYEWYRTDFQNDQALENVSLARRLVYADVIALG